MAQIDAFFHLMNELGASDLHLVAGSRPVVRIRGTLERVKFKVLNNDELKFMLYEITPEHKIKQFEETGDIDFSYEIPNLARYRCNFFQQRRGIGAVFREIPTRIRTLDELGFPPVLKQLMMLPKGLILVTGPTGCGKSTTLAAMIDHVNNTRNDHVITIEDPIEFVHENKKCLINQRELGTHTRSFSAALRGALREDPDIILVGEMRDLETISLALEAAETGHLVLSTVHTISADKTIDRIIEVFPHEQQSQVRASLADSLRAVISQALFKRIDKRDRIAALEIMIAIPAIRNLIRERKTYQIPNVIQTSKSIGMQSLDDAIFDLLQRGIISPEDAYFQSNDKDKFAPFLKSSVGDFVTQIEG